MNTTSNPPTHAQAQDIPDSNSNQNGMQHNEGSVPKIRLIVSSKRLIPPRLNRQLLIAWTFVYTIILAIFEVFGSLVYLALEHKPSPDTLNEIFNSVVFSSLAALFTSIVVVCILYRHKHE